MNEINRDIRCYVTNAGLEAEREALANGTELKITSMVIDAELLPDNHDPKSLTAVLNAADTPYPVMVKNDASLGALAIIGDIPSSAGTFEINGFGWVTNTGVLYAYARGMGDVKRPAEAGQNDVLRIETEIKTENASVISHTYDDSQIYTTHFELNEVMQLHLANNNPHPQYMHNDEHATQSEAEALTSAAKWMSPLRWKQAFLSRLSNAFNGTRQDYAVSEKALNDGLTDAIKQLHETGWGSDQPRTITNFNDNPETWSDGSAVLFRCISSTSNKPDDKVGVGMLFRYMKLENSPYLVAYHATDGSVYTATWDTANNQWIELSQSVTNNNLETFVTPITKSIMNKYGLSGRAPTAVEFGISSNDFNDITEDCQHLTITGTWNNTPWGDGAVVTAQLTVYRRKFDAGAAVVQLLHAQDGQIYHRMGSGVPITFPESWNKLLFASDAQDLPYDPTRTYKQNESCVDFDDATGEMTRYISYYPGDNKGHDPQDPTNRRWSINSSSTTRR